jgi:hypothetical protein
MSDPTEATQPNPHPVSQHRTPREIAADEAGPIGQPDLDVVAKKTFASGTPQHAAKGTGVGETTTKKRGKRR